MTHPASKNFPCACEACGASIVNLNVAANYCESCEWLARTARGEFDSPWASDAENRAKRANARAELRAKAVAL